MAQGQGSHKTGVCPGRVLSKIVDLTPFALPKPNESDAAANASHFQIAMLTSRNHLELAHRFEHLVTIGDLVLG